MTGRHHCSLRCIVPPHMLDHVILHGEDEDRRWALEALQRDHLLRERRMALALARAGAPRETAAAPSGTPGAHVSRSVYDAHQSEDTPGTLVRAEGGQESADEAVNQAYDGLGATYDLYWQVYHRDSIDGAGLPLIASVHYGKDYDNAFWNGKQMCFGDGGRMFRGFTGALDVIGHELTHGVTEDTIALEYFFQSGALNESISDVFGSLVKQYKLGQSTDQADWLIGAGVLAPGRKGDALRSMKAPGTAYDDPVLGKDPQPADMAHYVDSPADNGGVHINSGIPNRAFFLVASALGGNAWEKAGRIWYEVLATKAVPQNATFAGFAGATRQAAERLFGVGGHEAEAVAEAWSTVGVQIATAVAAAA